MTSPATPLTAERRESSTVCRAMLSALQCACRILDGGTDANVGGAAADVAVHGEVDVAVGRSPHLLQKGDCAHDLPGLAVAALRHVAGVPGALDGRRHPVSDPFDRRNFRVAEGGDRQRAGTQRLAVEEHGARPALGNPAPVLCSGQAERVAQHPQERSTAVDIDAVLGAVDFDGEGHGCLSDFGPSREWVSPTRYGGCIGAIGRCSSKTAPRLTPWLVTSMCPPYRWAIMRAIHRPMPGPPADR